MSKMSLRDLQSLFTVAKIKGNSMISKHNQTRRGIVNKNLTIVKKSSGPSSKAIARKIEREYKNNFRFFPA